MSWSRILSRLHPHCAICGNLLYFSELQASVFILFVVSISMPKISLKHKELYKLQLTNIHLFTYLLAWGLGCLQWHQRQGCAPFHQHPGENLGQGPGRYGWTCAPREKENPPFYTFFPSREQRQEYLVEVQQLKLRSPRAMGCQEMSVANTCQPCGNLGLWAAFPDERSRQQKPRVQLIVWQSRETFWVTHQTSLFCLPKTESLETFK